MEYPGYQSLTKIKNKKRKKEKREEKGAQQIFAVFILTFVDAELILVHGYMFILLYLFEDNWIYIRSIAI